MLVVEPARRFSAQELADAILLIKIDTGLDIQKEQMTTFPEAYHIQGEILPLVSSHVPKTTLEWEAATHELSTDDSNTAGGGEIDQTPGNPKRNQSQVPVDVKTVDEFIAETINQKETQRLTMRRTTVRRHMWDMQNVFQEVAQQDGGKRYAAYRDEYAQMTRSDLADTRNDLFTRVAAVDSLLRESRVEETKRVGTADKGKQVAKDVIT